jgi:hypothetical protein
LVDAAEQNLGYDIMSIYPDNEKSLQDNEESLQVFDLKSNSSVVLDSDQERTKNNGFMNGIKDSNLQELYNEISSNVYDDVKELDEALSDLKFNSSVDFDVFDLENEETTLNSVYESKVENVFKDLKLDTADENSYYSEDGFIDVKTAIEILENSSALNGLIDSANEVDLKKDFFFGHLSEVSNYDSVSDYDKISDDKITVCAPEENKAKINNLDNVVDQIDDALQLVDVVVNDIENNEELKKLDDCKILLGSFLDDEGENNLVFNSSSDFVANGEIESNECQTEAIIADELHSGSKIIVSQAHFFLFVLNMFLDSKHDISNKESESNLSINDETHITDNENNIGVLLDCFRLYLSINIFLFFLI